MRSGARVHRSAPGTVAALAALGALCASLAVLAFTGTASARRAPLRTAPLPPVGLTGEPEAHAPGRAQGAPALPALPALSHRGSLDSGEGPSARQPAAGGHVPGPGPHRGREGDAGPVLRSPGAPAHRGAGERIRSGVTPGAAGSGSRTGTNGGEAEAAAEVLVAPASETTRRHHAKGGRQGREGVGSRPPKGRQHQSGEQKGVSNAASPPAPLATAAAAPATGAASGTASTAPVTAPAASVTVPPASRVTSGAAGTHRVRRPRASPHAAGAEGISGSPLQATPIALETAGATAAAATPARSGAAGQRHAPAHAAAKPSTIVTTVTRIINVVPSAMRIALGVLAALVLAFALASRLIALRARRLARQRRELLDDVGLLQAALLPSLPERLGPVATSAAYRPASGPGAGGDFYDVFALGDGRVAVIVGDVSGHGRQALPHTTLLRYTLRAYLEAGLAPREALGAAAPVLERQLGESFATVVLAAYHPRERTLVYASAGHPPPIIEGSEAVVPLTACSSPPIGTGQPTGRRQTVVSVPGAASVCFYTDGVIEARSGQQLFGVTRLQHTLGQLGDHADARALLERVAAQSEAQPDDMAACLLRIAGDAQAPHVLLEEIEIDRRDLLRGRAERFLHAAGADGEQTHAVLDELRSILRGTPCAVLEVHRDGARLRVSARPQNVTLLDSLGRRSASA